MLRHMRLRLPPVLRKHEGTRVRGILFLKEFSYSRTLVLSCCSALRRDRIDNRADSRDAVRGKSTASGVLEHELTRWGVVHAVDLVVRYVAVHPLDRGTQRLKYVDRSLRDRLQLRRAQFSGAGQLTLDDKSRHNILLFVAALTYRRYVINIPLVCRSSRPSPHRNPGHVVTPNARRRPPRPDATS